MYNFTTLKIYLVIALLSLVPTSGFAQQVESLAPGVKSLIFAEQRLLSRDLNESRIKTPKANFQEEKYKPENSQIFEVTSYWVDKKELHFFESAYISDQLKNLFQRAHQGRQQALFLVHPESESLFHKFLEKAPTGPRFWATSTASSRTLLMWPEGRPELAFFGKLSLNKEIGGVVRTIPRGEVARSLGTNEVLYLNANKLPSSFHFMPESLSLIPIGFERGGMIIREIPKDLASGKRRFIPLFSLYAERGEKMPLLAEMINQSGLNPQAFVKSKIITPFVKQWMELVLVHGISMEPHAQNVLIGLNSEGLPDGTFMHRDFGGFNLNLEAFPKLETMRPTLLPRATTVFEDYHQNFVRSSVNQGLQTYFDQGFVYNLDQKLPQWVKKGWIPEYGERNLFFLNSTDQLFSKMIYAVMAEEFGKLTDSHVQLTPDDLKRGQIYEWVQKSQVYISQKKAMTCEKALLVK